MMGLRNWKHVNACFMTFFFLIAAVACNNKKTAPPEQSDTPASGSIKIVADESFAPLLRSEIATFCNIYDDATIQAAYLPEAEVLKNFFGRPEIRLMLISRRLLDQEKTHFEQMGLPAHEIKIAIDAVAFVLNNQNNDTSLTYDQVEQIVNGGITNWNEIHPNSGLGKVTLVFDNQQSSTVRYLSDKLLGGKPITSQAFAVDSNPAVIDYVEKDPGAIGVIGVSWISERGDSTSGSFLNRVQVAAISSREVPDSFYLPTKRFIYSMHYPFLRELFIVSQERHSGLGTGFATYVASDEGQRIVQRSGLLPIDHAIRIIELKEEF